MIYYCTLPLHTARRPYEDHRIGLLSWCGAQGNRTLVPWLRADSESVALRWRAYAREATPAWCAGRMVGSMSTAGLRMARDAALVVGLGTFFIFGTLGAQQHQVPPRVPLDAVGYLLVATSVLVLPGRHRWPWTVLGATLGVITAYLALGYAYGPIFLAASVSIYAVAGRASLWGCAGAMVAGTAALVGAELPRTAVAGAWSELLPLAGTVAAWLIIPAWWATARERLRQTRLTFAERHRRKHGEQRLALAREVHDVVAHNLAVIGIRPARDCGCSTATPSRHARHCAPSSTRTARRWTSYGPLWTCCAGMASRL